MDNLILIPHALLVFYGAVVLGSGSVLGFILGRNVRRPLAQPEPPLLARRVAVLEHELEQALTAIEQLKIEGEFLRELKTPKDPLERPRTWWRRIA